MEGHGVADESQTEDNDQVKMFKEIKLTTTEGRVRQSKHRLRSALSVILAWLRTRAYPRGAGGSPHTRKIARVEVGA